MSDVTGVKVLDGEYVWVKFDDARDVILNDDGSITLVGESGAIAGYSRSHWRSWRILRGNPPDNEADAAEAPRLAAA